MRVCVVKGAGSEPLGALTTTSTLIDLAVAGQSLFYYCYVTVRGFWAKSQMFCACRREQGQRLFGTELHQAFISL